MKRLLLCILCCSILFPAQASQTTSIDVFVVHDRTRQSATIFFTNAVSGLSVPVEIPGFSRDLLILEALTLTQDGVLFRHPLDGRILIATADGQLLPHPFIPQNPGGLLDVDWVLSPDGNTIAWVEIFFRNDRWVSEAYIADIGGTNLQRLPPIPNSEIEPFRRAMPLAITNDRGLFFYDAAFPPEPRGVTDYFDTYTDLYVYVATRQTHEQVVGEPGCDCGASISGNGFDYLRLEEAPNPGFGLRYWNLDTNADQVIPQVNLIFAQAGDMMIFGNLAFYTQAQNLASDDPEAQFALIMVDLAARAQTVVVEPSSQRFRPLGLTDRNEAVLLADVYAGNTYKLNLATRELTQVADSLYLGSIDS